MAIRIKCRMQIRIMKIIAPRSMLMKKNFLLAEIMSFEHSEQMSECESLEHCEKRQHYLFLKFNCPL